MSELKFAAQIGVPNTYVPAGVGPTSDLSETASVKTSPSPEPKSPKTNPFSLPGVKAPSQDRDM